MGLRLEFPMTDFSRSIDKVSEERGSVERPKIGDKAMFYLQPNVKALGTIMDIRRDEKSVRIARIAVLGWPEMGTVPTGQYHNKVDNVWRACTHPRGFDAAGGCFDCRNDWETDNAV
jgi:hypothetical protein